MATRFGKLVSSPTFWRGAVSLVVFLVLWEIGSRSKQWMAPEFFGPLKEFLGAMGFKKDYLPWVGAVPAPSGGARLPGPQCLVDAELLAELVHELLPRHGADSSPP